MGNLPRKPLGWILIGVAVLAGLWMLFGGRNKNASIPQTGGSSQSQIGLGDVFVASQVNANGCPTAIENQFSPDQTIYAGVQESSIPSGTELFMRLFKGNQPIEDSQPITASQNQQGCVWFAFQPTGQGFEPGNYQVLLMVNGNTADRAGLTVSGSAGALPGQSSSKIQFGQMYTTTAVDQNGCPTDDVAEFLATDSVYVAMQNSFVPAGTEMFARLLYQGQPIEDSQPITANRDTQGCVWFVFEPASQSRGFQSGSYSAEVYANGQLVDSLPFDVR